MHMVATSTPEGSLSKDFKYHVTNDLCRTNIEISWVEIHTCSNKVLVGVIYGSPNS